MGQNIKQNKIDFRAGEELLAWLNETAGGMYPTPDIAAKHHLEVLREAIDRETRSLALSAGEALLICDALNGCIADEPPAVIPLLYAQIEDAIRLDHLAEKHDVDGAALVAKLRSLSFLACYATILAARRWWQHCNEWPSAEEGLRTVGLVR